MAFGFRDRHFMRMDSRMPFRLKLFPQPVWSSLSGQFPSVKYNGTTDHKVQA